MKVLISAYALSPHSGSEPGVGWGFVRALADGHDLHVITEKRQFEKEILDYVKAHPAFASRITFHFIPRVRWRWLERVWPPAYYWTYRWWHKRAFLLSKRLQAQHAFDLAHQLTMVGFREPGYLWKLDIPFVWGPVGGMGIVAWRFLTVLGVYGAVYYLAYNVLNVLHAHFLIRPKLAALRAGPGLLTINEENRTGLLKAYGATSRVCIPVGPAEHLSTTISRRRVGDTLRIVWTGRHTPGKALNLGLFALARLPKSTSWELNVLGEGSRTAAWRKLSTRLRIDSRCRFTGWLPRDQALSEMRNAHVMLFTSVREGTPSVIVEAFALGLPVVCLDFSGMKDMVDSSCGIKIVASTPEQAVVGFAKALHQLAGDEALRQKLALGALERAEQFAWSYKAQLVDSIYRQKIEKRASSYRSEGSVTP